MTGLRGGAGTAVASSTSHMNTDNEHVSHKAMPGRRGKENIKIYK